MLANVNRPTCKSQLTAVLKASQTNSVLGCRKLGEDEDLHLKLSIREGIGPRGKKVTEELLVPDRDIKEALTSHEGKRAMHNCEESACLSQQESIHSTRRE